MVIMGTGFYPEASPHQHFSGMVGMCDPFGSQPLSDERREAFWRRVGWAPDLPEPERAVIEQRWDDESIEMAEVFGW